MNQHRGTRAALGTVILGVALGLAGCQPDSPPPGPTPTASPTPTSAVTTPTVSPSVTTPSVTSPTPTPTASAPALSPGFVDRLDGSTAAIPLAQAALKALRGTTEGLTFNTTPQAYDNLIAGEKDLILVSYPSQEEFAAAKEAGIELEIVPLVKDGLVFLANTANPVSGLTGQQIKDIYTGKVTDWGQVGGTPGAIIPYQRPVGSGSQTLFLKEAMDGTTPMDAPTSLRPAGMDGLVDDVAALGYSVFFYATQMYLKDTVKLLAVDGVAPSAQTISDESYPFITYVNAVFRKDTPADSRVRAFVAWLLGDDAQKLASAVNYVPLAARNIVASEPVYYLGATAENTTASSGTGGTEHRPLMAMPAGEYGCEDQQATAAPVVTVAGHPAVSQAVTQWMAARYGPSAGGCNAVTAYQDLISVSVPVNLLDGTGSIRGDIRDGAVFDVATGRQLGLSDLFYDKVNYIGFINDNLMNPWTNQLFREGDASSLDEADLGVGFTGLPRDYAAFELIPRGAQIALQIDFPQGNPFASGQGWTGWTRLPLPLSLSPYGAVWRLDYAIPAGVEGDGGIYSWGIPVVSTGFPEPRASDAAVNAAIKAAAEKAPVFGEMVVLYGSRLSVAFWGPSPDVSAVMPGPVASLVTADLVTGKPAPFSKADIPSNWWKGSNASVREGDNPLPDYVPPAGVTYRHVYRGFNDVSFEVVEPSGRVLEATVTVSQSSEGGIGL